MKKLTQAATKASIVLIPSYTAAYLTEKMVWVVPTLAAAGFFASTISFDQKAMRRRIDEDNDEGSEEQDEPSDIYEPSNPTGDGD